MIELAMVRRMVRRGLVLGPVAVLVLGLAGGPAYAASAAAGIALTLANLWMAGRIIGGLAENRPDLLLAGAFVAFFLGFVLIGVALVALRSAAWVDVPVAGLALVAAHLALVTWEAADAFLRLPAPKRSTVPSSTESPTSRS